MGQEQKEAGCRVLVSACLLGERCRWHGGIHDSAAARKLIAGCPYFTACPEMLGGLPCPRPPAKRIHDRVYETCAEKSERKHVTGADVTDAFELGAERTLAICRRYGIRKAILAKFSPSCDASGITGKLLRENGIEVVNVF